MMLFWVLLDQNYWAIFSMSSIFGTPQFRVSIIIPSVMKNLGELKQHLPTNKCLPGVVWEILMNNRSVNRATLVTKIQEGYRTLFS